MADQRELCEMVRKALGYPDNDKLGPLLPTDIVSVHRLAPVIAARNAEIASQASELATLRSRVETLERAVRPFAEYANGFGPHAREDSWVIATRPSGTGPLTMGHVRGALAALYPPVKP